MEHGRVTTGISNGLFSLLPTNTNEVVPEDSPASPNLDMPVAYKLAIASEHPATTGIPAFKPVSAAA